MGGIRYPGGKMAAGAREQIIRAMPPHRVYVEPFLGGGAVFFTKRPAELSILADRDEEVLRYLRNASDGEASSCNAQWLVADAITLLPSLKLTAGDLVYADPPYHPSTRTSGALYRFEMTDADHVRLLEVLKALPCMVMLSGYRCPLYDEALRDWRRIDYQSMTRGGVRTESIWMNFEPYRDFHDLRFVGAGFRERERIKRKRQRWVKRLEAMDAGERAVLLEALREVGASP